MTSLDDAISTARENWRVILLTVLLLASGAAIFVPSGATDGPTNLKYGIELDGGTRVRAPLIGTTAESVDMQGMNRTELQELEADVAGDLGVDPIDVQTRPAEQAVEVYADNVSEDAFRAALTDSGFQPDTIRDGVTEPTRQNARRVIQDKLRRSPTVTGGTVSIAQSSGDHYIVVEVPGATREELLSLIRTRGRVQVVAVFPEGATGGNGGGGATPTPTPTNGTATPTATPTPAGANVSADFEAPEGYRAVSLFTQEQLKEIGRAEQNPGGQEGAYVSVTLRDRAGANFSNAMRKFGFTNEGVSACRYQFNTSDPGYCLLVVRDGQVVSGYGIAPGLADLINRGEYTKTNSFQLEANNISEARSVQVDLNAGSLPTNLDFDEGTVQYIGPSQGQRFKLYSLITGIVAALAVSGMIFLRYREPKVALPMWLTALAEVFLLLGLAAAIQLPLDLARVAGFIAVIGTGVDDLVIIADEVMSEGDVRTRRVFANRFRKAFWVIGAAAVTTIIAMSPLFVLGLGDLSGFAGVTIVGVLIGVLITRPAYGDILRSLVTGDEE